MNLFTKYFSLYVIDQGNPKGASEISEAVNSLTLEVCKGPSSNDPHTEGLILLALQKVYFKMEITEQESFREAVLDSDKSIIKQFCSAMEQDADDAMIDSLLHSLKQTFGFENKKLDLNIVSCALDIFSAVEIAREIIFSDRLKGKNFLRALEIGCGNGQHILTLYAAARRQGITEILITGIENREEAALRARKALKCVLKEKNFRIINGDATDPNTYAEIDLEEINAIYTETISQNTPQNTVIKKDGVRMNGHDKNSAYWHQYKDPYILVIDLLLRQMPDFMSKVQKGGIYLFPNIIGKGNKSGNYVPAGTKSRIFFETAEGCPQWIELHKIGAGLRELYELPLVPGDPSTKLEIRRFPDPDLKDNLPDMLSYKSPEIVFDGKELKFQSQAPEDATNSSLSADRLNEVIGNDSRIISASSLSPDSDNSRPPSDYLKSANSQELGNFLSLVITGMYDSGLYHKNCHPNDFYLLGDKLESNSRLAIQNLAGLCHSSELKGDFLTYNIANFIQVIFHVLRQDTSFLPFGKEVAIQFLEHAIRQATMNFLKHHKIALDHNEISAVLVGFRALDEDKLGEMQEMMNFILNMIKDAAVSSDS